MEADLLTQREINDLRSDFWFNDFPHLAAATGIYWATVMAIGAYLL